MIDDCYAEYDRQEMPDPILDAREANELDALSERFLKLTEPGLASRAVKRVGEIVPTGAKELASSAKTKMAESDCYIQALKAVGEGFMVIEEQVAKFTIDEAQILERVNESGNGYRIKSLEEVCFVRAYDIDGILNSWKTKQLMVAFVEGAATGAPGFAGLPFNIALSTFLVYRAVQSVAVFYGYDVKNDPEELVVASEVFVKAISPRSAETNEISDVLGKIMLVSKAEAVGQTVKKGWTAMAQAGGVELLLTQMRALAHKSAQKALEKAGAKGLEESVFKAIFEQIGARLTQDAIARTIPFVSGGICALIDTAMMNRALAFARVFYSKRFLLEKEDRANRLLNSSVGIEAHIIEVGAGENAGCESEIGADVEPVSI